MTIDVNKLLQDLKLVRLILESEKDPKKAAGVHMALSLVYDAILGRIEEGAENGKDDQT